MFFHRQMLTAIAFFSIFQTDFLFLNGKMQIRSDTKTKISEIHEQYQNNDLLCDDRKPKKMEV